MEEGSQPQNTGSTDYARLASSSAASANPKRSHGESHNDASGRAPPPDSWGN